MVFEIFKELLLAIAHYPYLVSFFGGFLSEELLVFLAILSGRGTLPFWIVFVFGYLGALSMNSIWFFLGKSRFGKKISSWFSKDKKILENVDYINRRRHLFYLIATKFVYGTRTASAVYYGMKGMNYKKFILYDSIAVLVWALIMLPAGWMAGNGFARLLNISKGIEKFAAFILVAFLVVYVLNHLIRNIIKKEYEIEERVK